MYVTNVKKAVTRLHAKTKVTRESVRRFRGQPVCIVLKDGTCCLGWITGIEGDEIVIAGRKGSGALSPANVRQAEKALVSGLMPGFLGSMFGGGGGLGGLGAGGAPGGGGGLGGLGGHGGLGGLGGLSGMMGMVGKLWPKIRMGIGMVQTILPLLGGLKL